MRKIHLLLLIVLILIIISCEKNNRTNLSFDKVSGSVQKGPFLNGTAITISELSADLTPTGKKFSSQILDNKGTFEIKNVELSSQYVELKADGFYFNEISNTNSTAQLTLFALTDLTINSSLNVNILSNLEKSRVEYLISNGMDFLNAKKQAQTEILKLFEIEKTDIKGSELLDISKDGDDNAILLSVSLILQGYLSVSDLSELLANISTDIREDGVLNSQILGTALINNAKTIKSDKIRENLENRYATLGLEVTIPDFEKYVNQFINSANFEFTEFIKYPISGKYGLNILDKEKTEYVPGTYSMKAILPEGTSLKVKIGGTNWSFPAFQDNTGWSFSDYNYSDKSRIFTATQTGEIDFEMMIKANTFVTAYENDDTSPTWSKEIIIK